MIIITPEIKDKVLEGLLSHDTTAFTFEYENSNVDYGVLPDYVKLILDDFTALGLIKATFMTGACARIHIQAKAMDLYRHGGFAVEEELLKSNIEKLGLELDLLSKQLTPNYTEKASQIAQIASAIMQSLELFKI